MHARMPCLHKGRAEMFFRPNSRADWEGPWATCDTISGPGTRCFGGTVRPGRPENVPCLVLALPEDHPLLETRVKMCGAHSLSPGLQVDPSYPPYQPKFLVFVR